MPQVEILLNDLFGSFTYLDLTEHFGPNITQEQQFFTLSASESDFYTRWLHTLEKVKVQ